MDLPGLPQGSSTGIVMELVEGGTLADQLVGGPLPVGDALRLARDVAAGLQTAHDTGIIHRDLKPANIALTSGGRAKILDFGLGKVFSPAVTDSTVLQVTTTGTILGTAPHMSPEQARGLPLDRRTDVWSFGCVLYEMLTGSRPFTGASPSDVVAAILEREPDLDRLPRRHPPESDGSCAGASTRISSGGSHAIADARIELDEAIAPRDPGERSAAVGPAARPARVRERLAWIGVTVALAALALWLAARPPAAPNAVSGRSASRWR